LDCSNLCSDFREDIQFKFSLGFTSLWQRFVQTQKESLTGSKNSNELTSPPSSSSLISSTNELLTTANNISALTSKSGIIVLGASAFIWRGVGWKVVGVVAGIYAGLYLYERLMWTKKAQERAFKRQYADFTSSKMKLVVDMTSGNASFQVQQELSKYFAQTLQFIDIEKDALADQMRQTRIEMDQLSKYIEKGKVLKKQGDQIDRQISEFSKQYLSSDVPSNQ
jgi:mitofusin